MNKLCLHQSICIIVCLSGHSNHGIFPSRHSHHDMHQWDIHFMTWPQGDICIHCIPKRAFAFIAYPNGHSHSLHTYKRTFTPWHTPKQTFASWHAPRGHLHHDIPTKRICIMTYPLEGICTTRFLHLHLCKETFASHLNMFPNTIMDKLCIRTPTWDIWIMKIASLKKDMCFIWTFRICIIVKSTCIENEKSRLA